MYVAGYPTSISLQQPEFKIKTGIQKTRPATITSRKILNSRSFNTQVFKMVGRKLRKYGKGQSKETPQNPRKTTAMTRGKLKKSSLSGSLGAHHQVYIYCHQVKYVRSSTLLLHRQACTRKSHWGCPTRASEKRREQGVFPLGFTILKYCGLHI